MKGEVMGDIPVCPRFPVPYFPQMTNKPHSPLMKGEVMGEIPVCPRFPSSVPDFPLR